MGHLLSVVQASALLHAFQRERDGEGRIIALPEDYAVALEVLRTPLLRSIGGMVSEGAKRLHVRLRTEDAGQGAEFTVSGMAELMCSARDSRTCRNRSRHF